MSEKNEVKTLKDFLIILNQLTQQNIDFIDGKDVNLHIEFHDKSIKYTYEIKKIQELINSFEFVRINKKLLTHPSPKFVKEMFS